MKNGIVRPPRSYESATVMFVQLCEFYALMKRSKPDEVGGIYSSENFFFEFQVINFLNDIFDQFDKVVKRHDAYKVIYFKKSKLKISVSGRDDWRNIYGCFRSAT